MTGAIPAQPAAAAQRGRISPAIVAGLVRLGEWLAIAAAGFAVATGWIGIEETFEDRRYVTAILVTAFAAIAAAQRLELYTVAALTAPLRNLPKLIVAWATAMALLVVAVFLLKIGPEFSRGWMLLWSAAGFAAAASLPGQRLSCPARLGAGGPAQSPRRHLRCRTRGPGAGRRARDRRRQRCPHLRHLR